MAVSFDFGCAAHLYAKGDHPRLFLNPEDLDRLRAACALGWCRELLQSLRGKIAPVLTRAVESPDLAALICKKPDKPGVVDPLATDLLNVLDDMALVGVLDQDARTLDVAKCVLLSSFGSAQNGVRIGLAYDLLQPRLSQPERAAAIAAAIPRIQKGLADLGPQFVQNAGGNTPIAWMMDALGTLLTIIGDPAAPDLSAQLQELLQGYEAALYSAIGPEGYPAEDVGYGTMVAGMLIRLAAVLRRAGLYDAYTRCPRTVLFGRAMLRFVQPWGLFLSNTGDHGDDFREREAALATLARITNDPTMTWLLTTLCYTTFEPKDRERIPALSRETSLGPALQVPTNAATLILLAGLPAPVHPGQANVPTAFMDSDRAIAAFRSGWGEDDTFIYLDGSQRPTSAQGHAHDSAGHFNLSSVGEYFAVSPGRYGMEQDQHNVLLIDGKSGRSSNGEWAAACYQGRLSAYRPGELCDYAAADCSQQANAYWSYRHMGLVKGGGLPGYAWTVDDANGANDYRSFWWTLYTAPGNVIHINGGTAQIEGKRSSGLLDVYFAVPPPECYPRPHVLELTQDMPWTSSHKYVGRDWPARRPYNYVHHAVYGRPRLVAKVAGYNGRVMAVLIPRQKGQPEPVVQRLPTLPGALAMRIARGNVEDTLIFAIGHALLEADGVRGRGRWLVVRRDRKDRRLLAQEIHQGDWLEVDGRGVKI